MTPEATTSLSKRTPSSAAGSTSRGGGVRFLLVSGAAAGALVTLSTVDPNEPGHYPTCPFLAVTDLYCPGCGALRAVHAMTGGDIMTALDRNPLVVLFAPLLVLAWLRWGMELRGRAWANRFHPTRIPTRVLWWGLALVMLFWVARNIPGWSLLSPV